MSYEVTPPKGWAVTTVEEEMDIRGVPRCTELGGGVAVGFRREVSSREREIEIDREGATNHLLTSHQNCTFRLVAGMVIIY